MLCQPCRGCSTDSVGVRAGGWSGSLLARTPGANYAYSCCHLYPLAPLPLDVSPHVCGHLHVVLTPSVPLPVVLDVWPVVHTVASWVRPLGVDYGTVD